MTLRDQVWNEALEKLRKDGEFKLSDLPFSESEKHTVRRSLKRMEELGWLARESRHSSIWKPGEKARKYLLNTLETASVQATAQE